MLSVLDNLESLFSHVLDRVLISYNLGMTATSRHVALPYQTVPTISLRFEAESFPLCKSVMKKEEVRD